VTGARLSAEYTRICGKTAAAPKPTVDGKSTEKVWQADD